MRSKLSPEVILILKLFRIAPYCQPCEENIKTLPSDINWDKVLNYVTKNELIMFYPKVTREYESIIPENIQKKWKKMFQYKSCYNESLGNMVGNVLKKLFQENLNLVLLRGPALSKIIYNDEFFRSYADLDLLVRYKDIALVKESLAKLGYFSEVECYLSDWYLMRNHIHIRLVGKNNGFPVEVHWALDHKYMPYFIGYEKILAESKKIELLGTFSYVLSCTDEIMALAIHVYKHCTYLRYQCEENILSIIFENGDFVKFYELHLLLEGYRDSVNINKFIHKVKIRNLDIPIHYTFLIIKEMFGNPITGRVLEELSVPKISCIEKKIFYFYFSSKAKGKKSALGFFNYIRILDLYSYCFPGREYIRRKYSTNHFYLFYNLIHFTISLYKLFLNGIQLALYKANILFEVSTHIFC